MPYGFIKKYYFLTIILYACLMTSCTFKQAYNDKCIFRYNEVDAITSLDPLYTRNLSNINGVHQLFNGLVQLDDSLNILPCIAKKWYISDDGKEYVFYLNDNVFFHEDTLFGESKTRNVIASDFVYSFNRLVDPEWASPGAWIFSHVDRKFDGSPAVEAVNDTTLKITLKNAFSPFLGILSMKYCSVVPHEIVEFYGKDFRKHPIGTGPFKLKYWKEDDKLVLVKNDNYFEYDGNSRLPYLDGISISFIKEKQTVFLEFVKGNMEYMSGIDPAFMKEFITPQCELNPKYADKFKLITVPYLNTEYIGFIVDDEKSPFSDPYVCKAVNYAIDKDKMLRYLRANVGTPGYNGFIPPSLMKYQTNYYSYNFDTAIMLLKQSKFYNDGKFPEISIATTIEYSDLINYIQNRFSLIGIPVKIDIYPPAVIKEMRASGKLQCFRGSWVADYPDAENYLSVFYSKNKAPMGPNYFRYSNDSFDKLYEQSLIETNPSKRNMLYKEMDEMLMSDPPFTVLFYDIVLRFINKRVKGLTANPINLLELKRVKIDNSN